MASPLRPPAQITRTALTFARFFATLALALWIGGMAFFGIMAAPVLFHPERSGIARAADTATLAPQMVSAMLTRFGTLTDILAVVLLLCVVVDGILTRAQKNAWWRLQFSLSLSCLLLAFYLNIVLLPQTRREQAEILPLIARADRGAMLSSSEKTRRLTFDTGHTNYQRFASFNIYLLLAILFLFVARSTAQTAAIVPKPAPETVK